MSAAATIFGQPRTPNLRPSPARSESRAGPLRAWFGGQVLIVVLARLWLGPSGLMGCVALLLQVLVCGPWFGALRLPLLPGVLRADLLLELSREQDGHPERV